jgi:hypothetical protein
MKKGEAKLLTEKNMEEKKTATCQVTIGVKIG